MIAGSWFTVINEVHLLRNDLAHYSQALGEQARTVGAFIEDYQGTRDRVTRLETLQGIDSRSK